MPLSPHPLDAVSQLSDRRAQRAALNTRSRPVTGRQRLAALVLTILVVAVATLAFPALPAAAGVPAVSRPVASFSTPVASFSAVSAVSAGSGLPTATTAKLCSVAEWKDDFKGCVQRLVKVSQQRVQCLDPPTPSTPDSGMAGWFASRPDASTKPGQKGYYTWYGYAGYSFSTYDLGGCAGTVLNADQKFETTIANAEFMIATGVIGASNAVRERAWDPGQMWSWADPLVEQATRAVYQQVFSVFGVITLAVIGAYLMWRSRQSDMSSAMTTAGWALLVMVVVTALAAWPAASAHFADQSLIAGLSTVHGAVGPPSKAIPPAECTLPDRQACEDIRPPALRASDTAAEAFLYRNWLRGTLGSADSETAQKYGQALYDAKALTWAEAEIIRQDPATRDVIFQQKKEQWMKVAEQVRAEDPEAYEYLQGVNGMDRIGSGFIAMLSAIMFAMFDLTAALLVLIGFLLFRWAVIAAPILGTVGLLRPASAGIRRLGNAVVAALFNIVIFGAGAAVYLFAVDLIIGTPTLPGWLQVVLVWLTGVVGWILLRPYRRITQLGGKDSTGAISSAGSWHRRFFRDVRETAKLSVTEPGGTAEPTFGGTRRRGVATTGPRVRPEQRSDDFDVYDAPPPTPTAPGAPAPATVSEKPRESAGPPRRRMPTPTGGGWSEPSSDTSPNYVIYRPSRTGSEVPAQRGAPAESAGRRTRVEARRDV